MTRILITGAAGGVGAMLREALQGYAPLRLSDLSEMAPAREGEEIVRCDLADRAAVDALVEGCSYIVHLGGMSVENTWDVIEQSNIRGAFNIFDAARRLGPARVLFASSNHAIGFHTRETLLDGASDMRPDSLYGLSKAMGETMARYYWDKFGVESVSVRIGSCFPRPKDRRMLSTWLAPEDFVSLVKRIREAPRTGCTMVYGASANRDMWWDNSHAAFLGWVPQHSSEQFRAEVEAADPARSHDDPAVVYQGGVWPVAPHTGE
ncbi:NAD(P)-dependent oxidoreductase [Oceanicella sp. SM1341]|uniref:NAD-dependent epimerase/dehydratase family protein n=1 Tax=Oceanicella sp. SM1341 TaxID=1548889 RepID=UPI000E4D5647|nr:NAD(P)-dependent oxidoreductase [Oceanicella sp. SM1341]